VLALGGCPTGDPEPLVPEDYAATFVEVRDCRLSIDHELEHVRVLAPPDVAAVYTARAGDFGDGALIVKERHAADDCSDAPIGYAAMRRGAGYWEVGGDWHWQLLDADFRVDEDGRVERCATCHAICGTGPEGGFDWTCAMPP
jgi:hypothetical protein